MTRSTATLILALGWSGCGSAPGNVDVGPDGERGTFDAITAGLDATPPTPDDATPMLDAASESASDAHRVDALPGDAARLPDAPILLDPGTPIACAPWCLGGACDPPVQIATGSRQAAALRASGTVVTWGVFSRTPMIAPGIDDGVEVSVGENFTCVRRASGAVACLGGNRQGQLGRGFRSDLETTWADVVGVTDAVQLVSGGEHSCVRHRAGGVSCWGSDWGGALGDRATHPLFQSPRPVSVEGSPDVVQLAAAWGTTCARLGSGSIECWGSGLEGGIGDGTTDDRDTPVAVLGVATATDLSGGFAHFHATLTDETVMSWGRADDSELGVGWPPPPGAISAPISSWLLTGLAGISGGSGFSCGLGAPGVVACWGAHPGTRPDDYLLLGPSVVPGVTDAVEVRGGTRFACILRACGDVVCWGANDVGQLGNGTIVPSETPATVLPPA